MGSHARTAADLPSRFEMVAVMPATSASGGECVANVKGGSAMPFRNYSARTAPEGTRMTKRTLGFLRRAIGNAVRAGGSTSVGYIARASAINATDCNWKRSAAYARSVGVLLRKHTAHRTRASRSWQSITPTSRESCGASYAHRVIADSAVLATMPRDSVQPQPISIVRSGMCNEDRLATK